MSTPPELSTAWRVLAAPLATCGALTVQLFLVPRPTSAPFVFFFASVAVASWLGGRLAGFVSVALAAVVASFVFVDPLWRGSPSHLGTTLLFMASAAVVSVFCSSFRLSTIEARRLHAEMQDTEEFLDFALTTADTGAWELGSTLHAARRSRQHARIFGYDADGAEDWSFERFLARVVPEDRESVQRIIGAAVAGQGSWGVECRIRRGDGERRWIWAAGRVTRDPRSGAGRVRGIVRDITERKQSEAALRTSEEKFAKAFHGNGAAMAITRLVDGTFLDVNARWVQLTGYSRDEALTGAGRVRVWKEPSDRAGFVKVLREHGEVTNEYRLLRKSGEEWTARVSSQLTEIEGETVVVSSLIDVTERNRVEQLARESEQKYAAIHDHAPLAIALSTLPEGEIVGVNEAFASLFGFTREECVGKTALELGIIGDPAARVALYDALLEHGVVRDREMRYLNRARDPLTCSVSINVVWLGGKRHSLAVLQDVTERKRTDQALRESAEALRRSEEQLRLATDAAAIGLWSWSAQSDAIAVSTNWKRLFGFADDATVSLEMWTERIHPDDRARILGEMRLARTSRQELALEYRLVRPGGEVRWVISRGRAFPSAPDGDVQLAGVTVDITDRKLAEERVLRSREGLRRLAEVSLDVIREREIDGLRSAIVEGARKLTGARSAAYLQGEAESSPGAPALRAPMLDGRGHERGVIVVRGAESGAFAEEDAALVAQLATVASLALDHVEARLSLEEADRRKDDFLAMLSHELRNPLAPIRNSLHVLDRAPAGSEHAQRAHAIIDRQIDHMTKLVDDLLDVTRISRGKIQLHKEHLDLREAVRGVVDDHRDAFARAGVAVELDLGGPAWVEADRTRIAQIVGNLLANAVKFTEPGGTTRITLDDEDGEAVLRVRDSGVGIAPAMLGHVFEAFTQADRTLDRSQGGLGLGLALVKGLAEMHGGRVAAASDGIGHGAEIEVRLPLAASESAAVTLPPPAARAATRRVLVIEDNVDAAETLRMVLELEGHQVDVAFSGPEGVERARDLGPDLVLCDIGLPGMDGYAVARELRSDARLRGVKIVALTGYASPDDQTRAASAGFDDHLAKPPDLGSLGKILAELPGRHAA